MPVATLDDRGRFQLPRGLRAQLGLKPGDAVYYGEVDGELHLRKATDPYRADHIGEALRREIEEGKTKTIGQIAEEMGIDPFSRGSSTAGDSSPGTRPKVPGRSPPPRVGRVRHGHPRMTDAARRRSRTDRG